MRLARVLLGTTVAFLSAALASGCLHAGEDPHDLRSFLYILQEARIPEILTSGFRLVVMDYSLDGTDHGAYPPAGIRRLRRHGIVPLVYLSVGEAEDYRFYWERDWDRDRDGIPDPGAPRWLGRSNPDWPGNYKVRYWDPGWQGILLSYLDRILGQGFAGVYLDIIDAFEYWSDPGNPEGEVVEESEAARRMIDLIVYLSRYARERSPGFLVVPQNGERILDFDRGGALLGAVSGWGIEDLFYWETEPTDPEWRAGRIPYLEMLRGAGRFILVTDYVDDGTGYRGRNLKRIRDFILRARARGYIPYAARTDRELDRIVIIPGLQP